MKIKFIPKEERYTPEGKGKYKFMIGERVTVPINAELDIGEICGIGRRFFDYEYLVHFPNRKYPGRENLTFAERFLERVNDYTLEELLGIKEEDSLQ